MKDNSNRTRSNHLVALDPGLVKAVRCEISTLGLGHRQAGALCGVSAPLLGRILSGRRTRVKPTTAQRFAALAARLEKGSLDVLDDHCDTVSYQGTMTRNGSSRLCVIAGKPLARILNERMARRGMTYHAMAADMGVKPPTLYRIVVNDAGIIHINTAERISKWLRDDDAREDFRQGVDIPAKVETPPAKPSVDDFRAKVAAILATPNPVVADSMRGCVPSAASLPLTVTVALVEFLREQHARTAGELSQMAAELGVAPSVLNRWLYSARVGSMRPSSRRLLLDWAIRKHGRPAIEALAAKVPSSPRLSTPLQVAAKAKVEKPQQAVPVVGLSQETKDFVASVVAAAAKELGEKVAHELKELRVEDTKRRQLSVERAEKRLDGYFDRMAPLVEESLRKVAEQREKVEAAASDVFIEGMLNAVADAVPAAPQPREPKQVLLPRIMATFTPVSLIDLETLEPVAPVTFDVTDAVLALEADDFAECRIYDNGYDLAKILAKLPGAPALMGRIVKRGGRNIPFNLLVEESYREFVAAREKILAEGDIPVLSLP